MKFLTEGSWWLKSKSDPRWDCYGHTDSCGMFSIPEEVKDCIEKLNNAGFVNNM